MLATSFVGWFDKHATAVLVVVTIYYAWQNQRAVTEMRTARKLSVMPKLALEFSFFGPINVNLAVKNIGPGVALDLDLSLVFEPVDPSHSTETRRLRRSVLASGEQREFGLPDRTSPIEVMASTYRSIRLTGSMKDSTGATHAVSDTLGDLAEWLQFLEQADEQRMKSPEERHADELTRRLSSDFSGLKRAVEEINETLRELGQLSPIGPIARWGRQAERRTPPTVATEASSGSLSKIRRRIVAALKSRRPKSP